MQPTEIESALLAVYQKLQRQNLTLRDFLALRHLDAGAASLTDLATTLEVSTAAITGRADRLEVRGLEITTAGRALLAALR
jgi:DNA-binding MarR family transcriptional regulator